MKAVRPLLFSAFLLISASLAAQRDSAQGRLTFVQDGKIMSIIQKRAEYYDAKNEINGFRVQIFFDSGNNARNKANGVKAGFILKYPDADAYLSFDQPYYKVRVGDFRSRLDAKRFEYLIFKDYPNAFIVPDKIRLPKID